MKQNFTKFAFTDSVKKAQKHYGTRRSYARMEASGDRYVITDREAAFIQSRDGFYMATVGENGWPYVQFRGGPKGFLNRIDATTIGYADFRGNGQYISTGNMQAGNKVALILMDYPSRQRLKIWAEASIIESEHHRSGSELRVAAATDHARLQGTGGAVGDPCRAGLRLELSAAHYTALHGRGDQGVDGGLALVGS